MCLATFVLFYLMIVFALSWGTTALGIGREKFLLMQLFATLFFAVMIPISAMLAEQGRRRAMLWITVRYLPVWAQFWHRCSRQARAARWA